MAKRHSESSLLTSFLLDPASFPAILSFAQFSALFPPQHRSNPQVKLLYRDLQFLRTVDMDVIRENIAQQCKQGDRTRVEMLRSLHVNTNDPNIRNEIKLDTSLFGPTGSLRKKDSKHDTSSLLASMEDAATQLEAEVRHTEAEADAVLAQMQETVGGLSDLRYGKFSPGREEEAERALGALERVCE